MKHSASGGIITLSKETVDKIISKADQDKPVSLTKAETKELAELLR